MVDLGMDIYNGYNFYQKPVCNPLQNFTVEPTAIPTNSSGNSSHGLLDNIPEPIDELTIKLNYELYAAACFLFALGKYGIILRFGSGSKTLTQNFLLVPAYVQSIWSYYMYWVEEKQR